MGLDDQKGNPIKRSQNFDPILNVTLESLACIPRFIWALFGKVPILMEFPTFCPHTCPVFVLDVTRVEVLLLPHIARGRGKGEGERGRGEEERGKGGRGKLFVPHHG